MAIIEVKNLYKSFGPLKVFEDLNLEVKKSEVVAIIGASGCGKSVLLRLLEMLEKPDSGEIITNLGTVEFMRGARRNVVRIDTGLTEIQFKKIGIKDNVKWGIIQEETDEQGNKVEKEYDNSIYNLLGDLIIHSDGKVSFFMCESTNAELLNSVIDDLLEV